MKRPAGPLHRVSSLTKKKVETYLEQKQKSSVQCITKQCFEDKFLIFFNGQVINLASSLA